VAPLPAAVPSPQFHEYDTTAPSGSEDPDASTATARSVAEAVKAAVGAWFAAGSPSVMALRLS
jgi:hypothetical protein